MHNEIRGLAAWAGALALAAMTGCGGGGGGNACRADQPCACFIATAAYGSSMAGEVVLLRRFRDEHLMKSEAGQAFVQWYYSNSPVVAEYIRERDWLRAVVRGALWPVVAAVKHPAPALMLVLALLVMCGRRASVR